MEVRNRDAGSGARACISLLRSWLQELYVSGWQGGLEGDGSLWCEIPTGEWGEGKEHRYICEAETVSYAWVLVHVEVRWP